MWGSINTLASAVQTNVDSALLVLSRNAVLASLAVLVVGAATMGLLGLDDFGDTAVDFDFHGLVFRGIKKNVLF
jgi:hypothetical protein